LWGQPANDEDNVTCNLRFAGQYADAESGLHYNRFRYYGGETGQYLTPDPIGLLGGLNPYGYVHNPLSWVDPLGLASCPPVTETTTASNGLDYRSNPKHTLGGVGNSLKAGIEPRNSLDLFGDSVLGKNGNRYALDSDGSLHRFADSNDGSWHWNGSTGQSSPRPNLTSKQAGNDILNKFGLPKKGW
jgi:RHS repeat-associated protein